MDPEATLESIRTYVGRLKEAADNCEDHPDWNDVDGLTTDIESLDDWLSTGGFLPKDWKAAR